jgi:hypothetical protein
MWGSGFVFMLSINAVRMRKGTLSQAFLLEQLAALFSS